MATVKFLIAGLVGVARVVATAENEGRSIPSSLEERGELGTAAFESWVAQPKLHYVPCFECLLDDCNEKKRYGTTERIYTKCWVRVQTPEEIIWNDWYETVDGCYIDSGDISYPPNSNTALRDRDAAVRPVCDYDKPLRKPNITTPHTPKRNDNTITPLSQRDQPANPQTHQAALEPATVTSRYPLKCHQGSDPLWAVARTYAPQSNISISCWTTASMNASELLSYPSYEPTWLLTAQNCYVPKNEVTLAPNRFAYLSYCPSPRHYWAEIRNPRLARECPVGCRTSGFDFFLADFECWYKGDEVQGDTMWYRGWEVDYLGAWWTIWWPRAAVGRWGASGEPLEQCSPDKTVVKEPYHRPTEEKREKQEKAVGRAEPRAVMNVYALVNELDTRCRLCPRRFCPYYEVYQPSDSRNFMCFRYGSKIAGSDIWLRSVESTRCYIPRAYVTLNGGSAIAPCRMDSGDDYPHTFSDPLVSGIGAGLVITPAPLPVSPVKRDDNNGTQSSSTLTTTTTTTRRGRPPRPSSTLPPAPKPPARDVCEENPARWEALCFNQALSCCARTSEVPWDWTWDCSEPKAWQQWRDACRDLRTQTNCTMAVRLGNQMEGCEGGDVYRDPS